MSQIRHIIFVLLIGVLLFPLSAQENIFARRFQNGSELYQHSRWQEASIEFRRAQESARTMNDWSAALYWLILSELANSDYGSALRDMAELEKHAPASPYARDMVYHRARIYFLQGYFEEALALFNRYNNSTTDDSKMSADRRAASFFWMGECLYTMSQFEEAQKFYAWVIARYPGSPKFEAASYRMDLIKQKKIEAELLALLQLSHEEALRTSEDYQRTIRTYEHTLNVYQRRITDLTNTSGTQNDVSRIQNESRLQSAVNEYKNDASNVRGSYAEAQVIHDSSLEEQFVPDVTQINQFHNPSLNQRNTIDSNESLRERARQLGNNVQQILRDGGAR
ncbi:MAG: hypothetical protein FWB86_04390 [Treponema sp.]|nr:hypothetical protein [Treponema sp.]MCL2250289.1 hypothetical protein [Treponema sp.]